MSSLFSRISPRLGFSLVGLAALALVVVSVILTETLALSPCPLCIFQRMLYLLLTIFALLVVLWPRGVRPLGALALLCTLGGLATAVYQSWIQAFPDESLSCGYGEPNLIEQMVYWVGDRIPSLFFASGECTSVEWTMFGLSMANWSAVAFLGFSLALAVLWWLGPQRRYSMFSSLSLNRPR